ncbi:MAG: mannose-1-phosphate guanylyltransferase [Sphingomonadales bacterium]|nr:mannose-1-phosphate guanylyltransferase [Sphingomonadales bacterium]
MSADATIVPVILSGGSGTRLWPLSTPDRPKQFLRLTDPDESLFQRTIARCIGPAFAAPIVVASGRHRDLLADQLEASGVTSATIVLEPVARNTAAAIALAALTVPTDALLLVMPSDHRIGDVAAFLQAVETAHDAALGGALVTFGVTPDRPETGFGYIAMGQPVASGSGAYRVDRFVEKPDRARAETMVADGGYLWNAGIFLFTAKAYLDELEKFEPEVAHCAAQAMATATRNGAIVAPGSEAFGVCPSQSIDVAVMERSDKVVTVPLACDWSDIGSWDALADLSESAAGEATLIDSAGSFVHAEGVHVTLCGAPDLIVVASAGEMLIVPRGESQRVRDAVAARTKPSR